MHDLGDASALVTMPRETWIGLSESAGRNGHDVIDEIVYRLAASLDQDIIIETKVRAVPKDKSQ